MKNRLILFAALLSCGATTTAQAQTRPFAWGVTGGVNFSRIVGRDIAPALPLRVGYRIGLAGEYKTDSRWTLAGELAYSNQDGTGEIRLSSAGNVSRFRYQNRYVILPLLLRFSPGKSGFFLEGGAQVTRFLPRLRTVTVRRLTGLGLVVGAGYRLGRHLTADVRLTQDVVSRTKPDVINFTDQNGTLIQSVTIARNYNQAFSANLTYFF